MQESTVTTKGQTTIPRDVRAALDLKSGDKVRYVVMNGEVRLLKARPVSDLEGMLAQPGTPARTLADMDDAIATGATQRARSTK